MSIGLWAIDSVQGVIMFTSFQPALDHLAKQAEPKGKIREATMSEFAKFYHLNLKPKEAA